MGVGTVTRAVFLDRDGVLNRTVVRDGKPYPPADAASVEVVDGAVDCMALLKAAGFLLLVVTNQPDVARGTQSAAELNAINDVLRTALPLDEFFICPHDGGDGCDCRKPKPGLILQGAAAYGVDLASSFVIGDRWRDMDAARAAGVRGVWIDYGYAERAPSESPAATVKSLREAVDWIMNQETSR